MSASPLAEQFRRLHDRSRILVLANAWDVASARLVEDAGFPAIATSSAAVAWSLGYPDGERISRDEMAQAVRRVAAAVRVPVSADMEAGYGPGADDAVRTAEAIVKAGAVGMNFEDGSSADPHALMEVDLQAERIRAIKRALGDAVFLNARIDVFLNAIGPPEGRLEHSIARANAYRQAGADCLFVPGVRDTQAITKLVQTIPGPINILAWPGMPPIQELAKLGAARISFGSGLMRVMLTRFRDILAEIAKSGTADFYEPDTLTHAQVNELMKGQ